MDRKLPRRVVQQGKEVAMEQQTPQVAHDLLAARLAEFAADEAQHRRLLRVGFAAAVAVHLGLLLVQVPAAVVHATEVKPEYHPVVPLPPFRPPDVRPEPRLPTLSIPVPGVLMPEPVREEPVEVAPAVGVPPEVVPLAPPPPPPLEPERPRVVGVDIAEPRRVQYVEPIYPRAARLVRQEGVVILRATLDREGVVREVQVLRGAPLGLTEAAAAAVRQWRYEPALLDGRPVEVYLTVTVHFKMR
jgi:protein TonB